LATARRGRATPTCTSAPAPRRQSAACRPSAGSSRYCAPTRASCACLPVRAPRVAPPAAAALTTIAPRRRAVGSRRASQAATAAGGSTHACSARLGLAGSDTTHRLVTPRRAKLALSCGRTDIDGVRVILHAVCCTPPRPGRAPGR
jgi:hypothetical protein